MKRLGEEYGAVWLFLRTGLKKYIWLSAISLVGITVLTFFLAQANPDITRQLVEFIVSGFSAKGIDFENGNNLALLLICNNLIASGYSMLLGIVPFLLLPLWTLLLNGAILGFMGGFFQISGMGMGNFLIGVVPHGIFELPAFAISVSLGLYLSVGIVHRLIRRGQASSFLELIQEIIRCFILVVLPMIIIAGVVEAYITPLLLGI